MTVVTDTRDSVPAEAASADPEAPAAGPPGPATEDRSTAWVLSAMWLLVPVALGWSVWAAAGTNGADANTRVTVQPVDLVLLTLLLVWSRSVGIRRMARSIARPGLLGGVALGLAAVLLVALAAHPTPRGFELVLRGAALVAVADSIRRLGPRGRGVVLAAMAFGGAAEAVLGMAQSLHRFSLGLPLFEFHGPLWSFGHSTAGRGGFDHPYHLTCYLAVCLGAATLGLRHRSRPALWAVAVVLCAAGEAVTFSRSGLLGVLAAGVAALVVGLRRRDRRALLVAVALTAGFAVGMVGFGDGWVARSSTSTDAQALDSGRRDRLEEALRLTKAHPVLGVGPGNYVVALRDVQHKELLPAHDVVFQEAAEGGVLAGVLTALLFALLALRAWHRGLDGLLVLLPLLPFFVLDAYPYTFPLGLAATGGWVGLLLLDWSPRSAVGDERVFPRAVAVDR